MQCTIRNAPTQHRPSHTFGLNLETCPDCGGCMRMVAALTEPASVKTCLNGVGLDSEIPTLKPARSPPQTELDYDNGA